MSAESPTTAVTISAPDLEAVKARFAELYPDILRLASYHNRGLHGDLRDDAVADTIGLTWKSYRRMALEGGDPDRLLKSIVRFSAGHARAGKCLGGYVGVTDAMSRRGDRFITPLPHGDESADEVGRAIGTPDPAEEAACRADYAEWLESLSDKQRALAEDLASGMNMTEIAAQRGVSKAAVQDMCATIERKWDERFR